MRRLCGVTGLLAFVLGINVGIRIDHAAPPAATAAAVVKTGEMDLKFTVRSPLSTRKELARRLNYKESDLGPDYDLSKCPFKAYVPASYNPAIPCGVFVYLGYKDSEALPTLWEPILDKFNMIFITPVCHHGDEYPNSVPLWQVMGLAFDAVENLKRLYNIDTARVDLMSFNQDSMRMSLGAADVFTGLIVRGDYDYCLVMILPEHRYFPPKFPLPPGLIFQQAKRRGIILLDVDFSDPNQPPELLITTMKRDGFTHVLGLPSTNEDVHYPNLKPEWFEQTALPFLDKSALGPGKYSGPQPLLPGGPTSQPASSDSGEVPAANPEAEHLLRLARLYTQNGQPALARAKLEAIVRTYPNDPAAKAARQLLTTQPSK